jgi:hypothetical protein
MSFERFSGKLMSIRRWRRPNDIATMSIECIFVLRHVVWPLATTDRHKFTIKTLKRHKLIKYYKIRKVSSATPEAQGDRRP